MRDATEAVLDDQMRAALARLTPNEKACLRRRLLPQTAKEMALELGVSPHAVEKRLKMARAKLGVSSSLHAARLLAKAESGYQQSGPAPSDLAGAVGAAHAALHGAASFPEEGRPRRIASTIWRAAMIITFLAAALALGMTGMPQDAPAPADSLSGEEMRAILVRTFDEMDRDHSGFIEAAEAPLLAKPGENVTDARKNQIFMRQYDSNRDGKVSLAEHIANTRGIIQLNPVAATPGN